jgi:hypothetical protein
MAARGTRRPHARRPKRDFKPIKSGGGGGKQTGGSCTMAIPRLVLAVARVLSVEWHVRGAA